MRFLKIFTICIAITFYVNANAGNITEQVENSLQAMSRTMEDKQSQSIITELQKSNIPLVKQVIDMFKNMMRHQQMRIIDQQSIANMLGLETIQPLTREEIVEFLTNNIIWAIDTRDIKMLEKFKNQTIESLVYLLSHDHENQETIDINNPTFDFLTVFIQYIKYQRIHENKSNIRIQFVRSKPTTSDIETYFAFTKITPEQAKLSQYDRIINIAYNEANEIKISTDDMQFGTFPSLSPLFSNVDQEQDTYSCSIPNSFKLGLAIEHELRHVFMSYLMPDCFLDKHHNERLVNTEKIFEQAINSQFGKLCGLGATISYCYSESLEEFRNIQGIIPLKNFYYFNWNDNKLLLYHGVYLRNIHENIVIENKCFPRTVHSYNNVIQKTSKLKINNKLKLMIPTYILKSQLFNFNADCLLETYMALNSTFNNIVITKEDYIAHLQNFNIDNKVIQEKQENLYEQFLVRAIIKDDLNVAQALQTYPPVYAQYKYIQIEQSAQQECAQKCTELQKLLKTARMQLKQFEQLEFQLEEK